jgi:hypothetical protein
MEEGRLGLLEWSLEEASVKGLVAEGRDAE